MAMMKWTPFEEMELLRKQLDTLWTPVASASEAMATGYNPPVEI